jgi:hypothetical protein
VLSSLNALVGFYSGLGQISVFHSPGNITASPPVKSELLCGSWAGPTTRGRAGLTAPADSFASHRS